MNPASAREDAAMPPNSKQDAMIFVTRWVHPIAMVFFSTLIVCILFR
jgi:hypothetical protein